MLLLSLGLGPALALKAGTPSDASEGSGPPAATEATSQPDKSQFTLFNPTPTSLMREFNTDRPDKTESPYTLDAGHVQIEVDLITWTHDHENSGPSSPDCRCDSEISELQGRTAATEAQGMHL